MDTCVTAAPCFKCLTHNLSGHETGAENISWMMGREGQETLREVSEKHLLGQHGIMWPTDGRVPTCPSGPRGLQPPNEEEKKKCVHWSLCVVLCERKQINVTLQLPGVVSALRSLEFSIQARGSCQCNFNICISKGQVIFVYISESCPPPCYWNLRWVTYSKLRLYSFFLSPLSQTASRST